MSQFKTSSGDLAVLAKVCREYVETFDDDAVRSLLIECKRRVADATVEEVARAFRLKASQLLRKKGIENPVGLMLKAVPKCFEGESTIYRIPPKKAGQASQAIDAEATTRRLMLEEAYSQHRTATIAKHLAEMPAAERKRIEAKATKEVKSQWSHLPPATIAELAERKVQEAIATQVQIVSFDEFAASAEKRRA